MNKYITGIYNDKIALTTIANIEKIKRQVLSFNRNNGKIVYTNYPEFLTNSLGRAFADNGYFTNQQTVESGEVQVFFSHHNQTGENIWYGVQIFNPSDSQISFDILNWGFSTTFDGTILPLERFFTTNKETRYINAKSVDWVLNKKISNLTPYNPFYGVIRLKFDSQVIITTYAYKKWLSIDGYAVHYPYDSKYSGNLSVYSGYGDGFILSTSINIKLSELQKGDYWYYTGEHEAYGYNPGELTSIYLVGENKIASPTSSDKNLNNLGNWTTQYDFRISFTNDLSVSKTVYGFISGNINDSNPFIIANGKMKGWHNLKEETIRWFKETIPSGKTYTYSYSYMPASYGSTATNHAWSLFPELQK